MPGPHGLTAEHERLLNSFPESERLIEAERYRQMEERERQESIDKELERLRIQHSARQLLASENYRGSTLVDWGSYDAFRADTWLVPDLIGRGSTNLLVGRATVGKTFFAVSLICSGALGMRWLGRDLPQFKTLVYLSEGVPHYLQRYYAWAAANGQDIAAIQDNVRIYSGANLSSGAFQSQLAENVQEFKPDLVVFDTLSGCSGVSDENDAASLAAMLEATRVSVAGAAVLLVHHPNKGSESTTALDTRGSGVLKNNVDAVLALFADRNYSGDQGRYVALSTKPEHGGKLKDGRPDTIRGLYLEEQPLGATPDGVELGSAVLRQDASMALSKADEAALDCLTDQPVSAVAFARSAGVSRATGFRWLRESSYAKSTDSGWVRCDPDLDEDAIFID